MPAARRQQVLPSGWESSEDVAYAATGDSTGFHILIAEARNGYQWRTLTTLSEPGMDTDQWVGNACLTGDGDSAIAIYAPRHFTNRAELFARGAFAAVVDVKTGQVTKLYDQVSMAYFNPGCGAGEKAVLTQAAVEGHTSSRLLMIDAKDKKVTRTVVQSGQLTSAVPYGEEIVAASGNGLVAISGTGKRRILARTGSLPFDIRVDASGGVAYAEQVEGQVTVSYLDGPHSKPRTVAKGPLGGLGVQSGLGGQLFLLGDENVKVTALPTGMTRINARPEGQISTGGEMVVRSASRHGLKPGEPGDPRDKSIRGVSGDAAEPEDLDISARVAATGADLSFEVAPHELVTPRGHTGSIPNQQLLKAFATQKGASGLTAAGDSTVDTGYTCAVPRNDPKIQVYQPHWRQVEWAVDQLVLKRLTLTRPANWKGSNLPAWSPQALFPAEDLRGGGRVPTNIMLGILAQESNLWQAQRNVMEGETGNPLIGNYYGVDVYDKDPSNDWAIDFSKADCGYGLSQQTDGMRLAGHERPGETAWPANTQRAVAVDYLTNIAAGLRTLTQKWNQIWDDSGGTVLASGGDPSKIESWYFAAWAYNSGYHLKSDMGGPNGADTWGLGWTNNPSSGLWKPGRHPFLDHNTYADAATPQYWPYQEKVLGWAAWPIVKTYWDAASKTWKEQAGYNQAGWATDDFRSAIVPISRNGTLITVDVNAFCTTDNGCTPGTSSSEAGTCQRPDFHCWWHLPMAWKTCPSACGVEGTFRYDDPYYASHEREEPQDYWRPCLTSGLPSGSLVIDDVPESNSVPPQIGSCKSTTVTTAGTLTWKFGRDSAGRVPARADFQQLGNGYGGHQWFAYTRRPNQNGAVMQVTGTWTLDREIHGWARVIVHNPERRAQTQQAPYTVNLGSGKTETRHLSQLTQSNQWRSLGVFKFDGTPSVSLTTLNEEGDGTAAVTWDAIAIQPLQAKPKHFVVAMGDSYSSGEGVGNYAHETDLGYKSATWNACRRSDDSWIRKTVLPGQTKTIGELADSFDPNLDFHFLACSGATTISMRRTAPPHQTTKLQWSDYRDNADGRFREISQLDAGYLDENTSLVTLSITGNDAGFPKVVEKCYLWDCQGNAYEQELQEKITGSVNNYLYDLDGKGPVPYNGKDTLERISDAVQNDSSTRGKKAKIVLMGYPRIFDGNPGPAQPCSSTINFSGTEKEMLNRLSDFMAAQEASMAAGLSAAGKEVSFANPISKFGLHGACDADPWIIPVNFTQTGEGDFGDTFNGCLTDGIRCASRTSMHPNAKGVAAYTQTLQEHLASTGINYTGW
ncbi:SGNH/GDSL hydrolase family protein [Nonomuraea sp. NPDC048881]|uniref:SGNH/GDSL hydrolase family protein n=1 Tax=Nonomuraea sp. NPDC048881 TaxID=3155030 RepID=UPI0033FED0C1